VVREEKVCKYVDLPIQHINDRILKAMGRKVTGADIRSLVQRLRAHIPGVYLRTSIIVGFPGETETEFQELLEFLREVGFERLGAFTYSKEEGTEAAQMSGQIPQKIKEERLHRLMELQKEIATRKNRQMVGKEVEVLVDGVSEAASGLYEARFYGDAPEVDGVIILSGENLEIGNFYQACITGYKEYDLLGKAIGAER
jgi:ribosomal protein S12 methylthiotransferase